MRPEVALGLAVVLGSFRVSECTLCGSSQFDCGNGRCVRINYVCDDDNDCGNNRDEDVCRDGCPSTHFHCENPRGRKCIPSSFVCDRDDDCADGADEERCPEQCNEGRTPCRDGLRCVATRFFCDGDDDCDDGSDESNCTVHCTTSEFFCRHNSPGCLSKRLLCDGESDCSDGSDEEDCPSEEDSQGACDVLQCPERELPCRDKRTCINETSRCDGDRDCTDGSDEEACPDGITCNGIQFPCRDRNKCVERHSVCDGIRDCEDWSDELECDPCVRSNCTQLCKSTGDRPVCTCHDGFRLQADGVSCEDIDECAEDDPPRCGQRCINAIGHFLCTCYNGYFMMDGECKAAGPEALLVFADDGHIRRVGTNRSKSFIVHPVKGKPSAVDVDGEAHIVFWAVSDSEKSRIHSCFMDGSGFDVVASLPKAAVRDIAFDWIVGNLYLTDSWQRRILVCEASGDVCASLVTESARIPWSIVLIPHKHLMLWSAVGSAPAIMQARMDGSNISQLLSDDLRWPTGLTYDHFSDTLYFCDPKLKKIESIHLSSMRRRVVSEYTEYAPGTLDNFEGYLFWIDWFSSLIRRSQGDHFPRLRAEIGGTSSKVDFRIYHPSLRARNITNHCEGDPCQDICVLKPGGYRCLCRLSDRCNVSHSSEACVESTSTTDDSPGRSSRYAIVVQDGVYRINHSSEGHSEPTRILPNTTVHAGAAALDRRTHKLYVYDFIEQRIVFLLLDNGTVETFRNCTRSVIVSMDFDEDNRNLYTVDAVGGTVAVQRWDGKGYVELLKNIEYPKDLALYPEEGLMFLLITGSVPYITRYTMDGRNPKRLELSSLMRPVSLFVNTETRMLLWADAVKGNIEATTLKDDVVEPTSIVSGIRGKLVSASSAGDVVYWLTRPGDFAYYKYMSDDIIYSVRLPKLRFTTFRSVIYSGVPRPRRGVCSSFLNRCQHVCVPSGTTPTCLCPGEGLSARNGSTCT